MLGYYLFMEPIKILLYNGWIGKYVVGLKKFVDRQMVDKFLSKNFRRHSTSSTKHFVEKYFVEKFSSTKHFVDTALRRHSVSSTCHFIDRIRGFGCRMCVWVWGEDVEWGCESVVYSTPALISTPSMHKDSLTFFLVVKQTKQTMRYIWTFVQTVREMRRR